MQNQGRKMAAAAGFVLLAAVFILAAGSVTLGKDVQVPRPRFHKPVVRGDTPDIMDPAARGFEGVTTRLAVRAIAPGTVNRQ